jgi:hypothetical protein
VNAFAPAGTDVDSVFDVKVVYPQAHVDVDLNTVPAIFLPRPGPFELIDYEKIYAALRATTSPRPWDRPRLRMRRGRATRSVRRAHSAVHRHRGCASPVTRGRLG